MTQAAKAAGPGRQCLPHGLRKACLRRLAQHGGSAKEIAAVSGHKSLGKSNATQRRPISGSSSRRLLRAHGETESEDRTVLGVLS